MKINKLKKPCFCYTQTPKIHYKHIFDDLINIIEDESLPFIFRYNLYLLFKGVVEIANDKKNNN